MAYNIIRPRHGIKSLWDKHKSRVYKTGEILVESPETGVGSGPVNIKFGDGVTDYENLPYAVQAPINDIVKDSTAPLTSGGAYTLKENVEEAANQALEAADSAIKAVEKLDNVDNTSDEDKPVSKAVQEELDKLKQAIIDVDAMNEASGSPILLTDTADGVLEDFNAYGRSKQTQYSGKNKLDCSGLSATTTNGVTFTPVYDDNGSLLYVNVNGTATATASFVLNSNMLFDVESYILNGCPSGGSSSTYKLDVLDTKGSILVVDSGNGVSFDVASAFTSQGVRIVVYGGVTANNLKFYPMLRLASVTDSTYEPYTNGASPNPTYPQAIKSVGDMGWFDGELLSGYYQFATGTHVYDSRNIHVCSKNPIPCVAGDSLKFTYEEEAGFLAFIYYDKDMNHLFSKYIENVSEISEIAPTNASYFHIDICEADGITPQTAKHICVTINDKYALIEKSVGKNLLDVNCAEKISSAEQFTVENNIITVKGIGYGVYGVKFSNNNVGLEVGKTYTFSAKSLSGIQLTGYRLGYTDGTYSNTYIGTIGTETIIKEVDYILFYIGTPYTGNTDVLIGDMQIELGNKATDYEPYIKSRKYIPISAPLRGLGEVTDVLNLSGCKVTRRFASITYDGNSGISMGSSLKYFYSPKISNAKPSSIKLISTHYKNNGGVNVNYGNIYIDELSRIIFADNRFSTVSEVKEWLSANPITVIYELAEPITESIEPIDVDTFEGVTHISVSDNAEMWIQYYSNSNVGQRLAKTNAELDKMNEHINTSEEAIANLESFAVQTSKDIEDIKNSMSNPPLVALTPSDEPYTIASGSAGNVASFKDTWLNRPLNDREYLLIEITHRNNTKQIVQIPSIMLREGTTYSFQFNDVQNTMFGAYIKIDTFTRYSIGLYGTAPSNITFMLYNYGNPVAVG